MENADRDEPVPTVDEELMVVIIALLLVLVGAEGVFLGWGMNKAAQWAAGAPVADRTLTFVKWFAAVLTPVIAFNAALGAYVARVLSTPLIHMRRALNEAARGNLEHELDLPADGFLSDYTNDCRRMLETVRRLTYRDHASAQEASALLAEIQALVAKADAHGPESAKISELLNKARAQLSVINRHFTRGRKEAA